jgi:hypothetical protein
MNICGMSKMFMCMVCPGMIMVADVNCVPRYEQRACQQCMYVLKSLGATVAICLLHGVCYEYGSTMCMPSKAIRNLHTVRPLGNHHIGCHCCQWA